jgi:hypothetical protein
VLEHDGAFRVLHVLVQAHAGAALPQDARQRRLAHFKWFPTKIRAVELQQAEGMEAPDEKSAEAAAVMR